MPKLRPLLLLTLFAASLLCAAEARADPVVLIGGEINGNYGYETYFVSTSGNGISFGPTARYPGSIRLDACAPPPSTSSCIPNQTASGSASVLISYGQNADITLNGVRYTHLALQDSTLRFETPVITFNHLRPDPLNPGSYTVDIPFTMTGTIVAGNWIPTNGLRDGPPLFTFDVTGAGRALINVDRDSGGRLFFRFVSYQFQPQPAPEPATLVLFGAGAAGLAAHLRRRRRRTAE